MTETLDGFPCAPCGCYVEDGMFQRCDDCAAEHDALAGRDPGALAELEAVVDAVCRVAQDGPLRERALTAITNFRNIPRAEAGARKDG